MTLNNRKRNTITALASIIAIIAITTVISDQAIIEAQLEIEVDQPRSRSLKPFMFVIPENYYDGVKYSGIIDASPVSDLPRGKTVSIPMIIRPTTNEPINIKFHTTFGSDQIGIIKHAPGISAIIEPNVLDLEPGKDATINVKVTVDSNAPDGMYYQGIVGRWDDVNGFTGTSVYLKVGNGSERALQPEDIEG